MFQTDKALTETYLIKKQGILYDTLPVNGNR